MNLADDPFLAIANTMENRYIKEWQKDGKKVIGYYCTYIPDELLDAGGFLPFRIRATGNKSTELGDMYMVRFTCSFVRATLDLALKGGLDFLDGYLICNSCDHSRRMYEIFDMRVFNNREGFTKEVPRFYLSVPHIISEEAFDWFRKETGELKHELEEQYQIKITNEQLENSIRIYNENRTLLKKIYDLRLENTPKLTAGEALQISLANSSIPKAMANKELKRLLTFLEEREGIKREGKRILLSGSIVDDVEFLDLIENAGGLIVSDLMCFGFRNSIDNVDLQGDPLEQISRRTYFRMSCPRMMDDHEKRWQFLKKEIKRANVDGVILQRINNCDLHGCDNMLFEHELKELDIPVFNIDREYFQTDSSRLQTRIEAFLEMLN